MPTQMHLPVQPARAESINAVLAIVREGDEVAYFASGVPVFVHAKDDAAGQRLAAVQMMELGLARQDELSAALEVNRTTLYRQSRKVKAEGVLGVVEGKRGPRGPHRFNAKCREQAQGLLAQGLSLRQTAKRVGVDEATVRLAVRTGELKQGKTGARRRGRGGAAAQRTGAGAHGAAPGSRPAVRGR
ncbi:MAG: helix-turn-helix domain-containing protein [Burkholderiales bacterium]